MKAKKSKKKIIVTLILLVLAAAVIISTIMKPKPELYTEEAVKTRDITTYYSFSGNIEAKDSQEVFSKSTLSIKTLHVKEGDRVKTGDLLFELDASSIESSLDQAAASVNIAEINYEKALGSGKEQQMAQVENVLETSQLSFDNAALNLERTSALYEEGGVSKADLEKAQSAYDNARISLKSAQKNYDLAAEAANLNIRTSKEQLNQAQASYSSLQEQLEDTKVFAEVSGEIDEIYMEENDSLIMGTKIMDIVNYDDLEVNIRVDEYDLAAVTTGKEAEVTISAIDKKISGKVSDISRQAVVVNEVSYFPTTISLQNDEELRVGMSVEIKILNHNEKNVTTISMKALQFDNENKPFVYCRDAEGNVVTKNVTVGVNDGIIVQIIDGVKAGETILLPKTGIVNPFMAGGPRED